MFTKTTQSLLALVAIVCGILMIQGEAHAQFQQQYFGRYDPGFYPVGRERIRYYAFSYVGDPNDTKQMLDRAWQAVRDTDGKTAEFKQGDGNFVEARFDPGTVFVIGWFNPDGNGGRGEGGYIGTHAPGRQKVFSSARGWIVNTGWRRESWRMGNGHNIHLQLGEFDGKTQWQMYHDQ